MQETPPSFKINFDLADCDKVRRVGDDSMDASGIMALVKEFGFRCEVLDYPLNNGTLNFSQTGNKKVIISSL